MRKTMLLSTVLLLAVSGQSTIVSQIGGTFNNWTTEWTAITGLNDADNGLTADRLDFVGDSSDAGAYWADNGTYLFFRVRVDAGVVTSTTYSDTLLILIDVDNYLYGSGFGTDVAYTPDFSLTWDSSALVSNHGFEMGVRNTAGSLWSDMRMYDLDGNGGQKGTVDINGDVANRGYDGYIRSVDSQSTTSFGTTTFIDFAISWSYLETYTDLERGQKWNLALGSIQNANDHNAINADVAGNADPTSAITTGWTTLGAVPEPTVIGLLSVAGFSLLIGRRLFKSPAGRSSAE